MQARSLGAMGVICCNSEGTPAIAYGSINPKTLRLGKRPAARGIGGVNHSPSGNHGKRSIAGPGTGEVLMSRLRDGARGAAH